MRIFSASALSLCCSKKSSCSSFRKTLVKPIWKSPLVRISSQILAEATLQSICKIG